MQKGKGHGIVQGTATGILIVVPAHASAPANPVKTANPALEIQSFIQARAASLEQLTALQKQSQQSLGQEESAIFEAQAIMLMDEDFEEAVFRLIREEKYTALSAVEQAGKELSGIFLSMDDERMQSKSADIRDLVNRLKKSLKGGPCKTKKRNTINECDKTDKPDETDKPNEAFVLFAEELTPGELMQWHSPLLRGLLLNKASAHSHLAVLAAAMNIPTIISADINVGLVIKHHSIALNASQGIFYLDPDSKTLQSFEQEPGREAELNKALSSLRFYNPKGQEIEILANIGSPEELETAIENGCKGIGLFRSEFMYLGREEYPSEEELFRVYRRLAEGMAGQKVVIRTLDIGADKNAPCFDLPKEENPALGKRGIRLSLDKTAVFNTQLRAICRASAFGKLMLMFPMIISVEELLELKHRLKQVQQKLRQEGIKTGDLPVGTMIETPAAAILCAELAAEADFFSIGTNDLTQYTLAVDRQNTSVAHLYNQAHPAIMRMLEQIARVIQTQQIPCSICGELAHDTNHIKQVIEMGYTSFSMAPLHIPAFRKYLSENHPQSIFSS